MPSTGFLVCLLANHSSGFYLANMCDQYVYFCKAGLVAFWPCGCQKNLNILLLAEFQICYSYPNRKHMHAIFKWQSPH